MLNQRLAISPEIVLKKSGEEKFANTSKVTGVPLWRVPSVESALALAPGPLQMTPSLGLPVLRTFC